jgi:hypothetical protein
MTWTGGPSRALSEWEETEIQKAMTARPRTVTAGALAARHNVSVRLIYRTVRRRKGYCSVAPCPVRTPMVRCYFHSDRTTRPAVSVDRWPGIG